MLRWQMKLSVLSRTDNSHSAPLGVLVVRKFVQVVIQPTLLTCHLKDDLEKLVTVPL